MMAESRNRAIWIGAAALMGTMGTARASLLSLYTFDNTTDNAVATAPDGSLASSTAYSLPTYDANGPVGQAIEFSVSGSKTNWVDTTANGFPRTGTGNGITSGTLSFWINDSITNTPQTLISGYNGSGKTAFLLSLNTSPSTTNSMRLFIRQDNSNDDLYYINFTSTPVLDGQWHQMVLTYDVQSTGTSDGGAASVYIDGQNAQSLVRTDRSANSNQTNYASWNSAVTLGSSLTGKLDDLAVFGDQLDAGQAKAVYNLATDSLLNYGVLDADKLFTIFAGGAGSEGMTSDGMSWQYVTGLSGDAGSVLNHNTLILDSSGNGVQVVPEPGSTVFLAMGAWALLRIRRRRTQV